MIKLDDNLLKELGLDVLPKEEKAAFLRHMYETLEMRVGTRLAERMSDQQMVEFEQFINTGDEQGAFKWLEANFPNYKEVVAEEFEKLKGEVRPLVPQIVAASQQQAQMHQPPPTQPQQIPPEPSYMQHPAYAPQQAQPPHQVPPSPQQPQHYAATPPPPPTPPPSPYYQQQAQPQPPQNPYSTPLVNPPVPPVPPETQQQHDLAA